MTKMHFDLSSGPRLWYEVGPQLWYEAEGLPSISPNIKSRCYTRCEIEPFILSATLLYISVLRFFVGSAFASFGAALIILTSTRIILIEVLCHDMPTYLFGKSPIKPSVPLEIY
jgi:hypothetical protein